jgi:hypothetical protein
MNETYKYYHTLHKHKINPVVSKKINVSDTSTSFLTKSPNPSSTKHPLLTILHYNHSLKTTIIIPYNTNHGCTKQTKNDFRDIVQKPQSHRVFKRNRIATLTTRNFTKSKRESEILRRRKD